MFLDNQNDPTDTFINRDVQAILKSLTRADYDKVFRRRKLGDKHLSDPEYKFMTDSELQQYVEEARKKADELLQIPPVVKVRDQNVKVLSNDPALSGKCLNVFYI